MHLSQQLFGNIEACAGFMGRWLMALGLPAHVQRVFLRHGFQMGFVFVATAACWSGCVGPAANRPAPKNTARIWPEPPATPRIAYGQTIYGPADLGVRFNGFKRFTRWLFGADEDQETLSRPFGVALDPNGNLCLTDTGMGTVCFFDRSNKTWHVWNTIGKTKLLSPVSVVKNNDTFYVADSVLQKVLAFDIRGRLLFELGHPFERPSGLVIAGKKLWVADAAAHRIFAFDLKGQLIDSCGKRGTKPGEFNFPTHLATDGQERVYVTDSMNFRIQILDLEGRFQSAIGAVGDHSGALSRPKGIAVDGDGHLYVMDALFDNMQIFNQQGQFLLSVGEKGSEEGEFWMPAGIAISREGQIYVADTYNRRIQVFQYLRQP
jgi:sugar lactone lactonase YvrE